MLGCGTRLALALVVRIGATVEGILPAGTMRGGKPTGRPTVTDAGGISMGASLGASRAADEQQLDRIEQHSEHVRGTTDRAPEPVRIEPVQQPDSGAGRGSDTGIIGGTDVGERRDKQDGIRTDKPDQTAPAARGFGKSGQTGQAAVQGVELGRENQIGTNTADAYASQNNLNTSNLLAALNYAFTSLGSSATGTSSGSSSQWGVSGGIAGGNPAYFGK